MYTKFTDFSKLFLTAFLNNIVVTKIQWLMVVGMVSVSGLVNHVYPSAYEPAVVLCIPILPIGEASLNFLLIIFEEKKSKFTVRKGIESIPSFRFAGCFKKKKLGIFIFLFYGREHQTLSALISSKLGELPFMLKTD